MNFCYNINGNIEIDMPSMKDLLFSIKELKSDSKNFVVLEGESSVNNVKYIQATDYNSKDDTVWAEVQLVDSDLQNKACNRGKRINLYTFIVILINYMFKSVPNTNDWKFVGYF